jgi:hypothetical protein
MSPGDRARNQIDYIIFPSRWRSTLHGVKTRPGADCGSDHQLLQGKIKIRLKARKYDKVPVRYDIQRIPLEFTVTVKNRFLPLLEMNEDKQTPNEL